MKLHGAVRILAFGLLLLVLPAALPSTSSAQIGIGISVRIGPPALPVYEMPLCPGEGFLWVPGYWAWDDDDGYYWVPGTWIEAPEPGFLWTPGYWGWNDGLYVWNAGYWGTHVGFYGGINYGFGYFGTGFGGGEWRSGRFFYNTAVVRVDSVHITNVYINKTVIVNNETHVAFNGGQGGVQVRPTPQQESYAHERHIPPVAAQVQHVQEARKNPELFASRNHGRPAVAATAKPGDFRGKGVVAAKAAGAAYHPPAISPKEARGKAPAETRSAEKRPAENRAAPAKAANRPASPANKSAAARPENAKRAPEKTAHPAARPAAKPSPASARPAEPKKATPARTETAKAAPRPASTPHPAAKASAPKPAPRESAPKPAAHSAPKPEKPSAAPKREPL